MTLVIRFRGTSRKRITVSAVSRSRRCLNCSNAAVAGASASQDRPVAVDTEGTRHGDDRMPIPSYRVSPANRKRPGQGVPGIPSTGGRILDGRWERPRLLHQHLNQLNISAVTRATARPRSSASRPARRHGIVLTYATAFSPWEVGGAGRNSVWAKTTVDAANDASDPTDLGISDTVHGVMMYGDVKVTRPRWTTIDIFP